MAEIIATKLDVLDLGGTLSSGTAGWCPPKSDILSSGCGISNSSSYSNNLLVCKKDLTQVARSFAVAILYYDSSGAGDRTKVLWESKQENAYKSTDSFHVGSKINVPNYAEPAYIVYGNSYDECLHFYWYSECLVTSDESTVNFAAHPTYTWAVVWMRVPRPKIVINAKDSSTGAILSNVSFYPGDPGYTLYGTYTWEGSLSPSWDSSSGRLFSFDDHYCVTVGLPSGYVYSNHNFSTVHEKSYASRVVWQDPINSLPYHSIWIFDGAGVINVDLWISTSGGSGTSGDLRVGSNPINNNNSSRTLYNYSGRTGRLFPFKPSSSRNYTFAFSDTNGSNIDTYGFLFDANMNMLTSNDDSNGDLDPLFSYYCYSGSTYYYMVTPYSTSSSTNVYGTLTIS